MFCRKNRQSHNQAGNQEPQNTAPVTSAYLNTDPYESIPDHMVYSTEAHRNGGGQTNSTYYTEPYADTAAPQARSTSYAEAYAHTASPNTGPVRYYNISENEETRNPDYENSPNQIVFNTQETNNYEDVSAGYEHLRRVE